MDLHLIFLLAILFFGPQSLEWKHSFFLLSPVEPKEEKDTAFWASVILF